MMTILMLKSVDVLLLMAEISNNHPGMYETL